MWLPWFIDHIDTSSSKLVRHGCIAVILYCVCLFIFPCVSSVWLLLFSFFIPILMAVHGISCYFCLIFYFHIVMCVRVSINMPTVYGNHTCNTHGMCVYSLIIIWAMFNIGHKFDCLNQGCLPFKCQSLLCWQSNRNTHNGKKRCRQSQQLYAHTHHTHKVNDVKTPKNRPCSTSVSFRV